MSELFYIQNRDTVGNCILWWAKESRGYTTDLAKAQAYTIEEAQEHTQRSIDTFWPKEYIDERATRQVDIQHTDYRKAQKASNLAKRQRKRE